MQEKKPNYLLIAALVFQVIFVVVLIASLSRVFQSSRIDPDDRNAQPSVTIVDLDKRFQGLPADVSRGAENELFLLVQKNNIDVDFGAALAFIREDSANYVSFENEKFDFYNFIVDIPDLSQSYQLFLTVSMVENNKYIDPNSMVVPLCLSNAEEKVYPNFECKDIYDQKTRNAIALKYVAYFNNGYILVPKLSNLDNLKIMANNPDDDSEWPEDVIDEVKNDIRSLGVSPDLFTYDVEEFREN